jgi:NADPH:quinone reductase-like Zn-dependent oxidoreductase
MDHQEGTMKAIVQDRYGSPDVLAFRDVADPVPAADQVLVRVHAAAVNARDWHVMRGDPYLARLAAPKMFGRTGPRAPIRGSDIAGLVEAVGAGVTRWKPGDKVYGDVGGAGGAFAEFVAAPAALLDAMPDALTFEEAAALPLAGITALQGLRDAGQVGPGHSVLINGASGGVGTFAVQIAKALGTTVTAVCSTRNVDLVRSLGADDVVDYRRTDFAYAGRRYDVVFDLVANRSLGDLRRALAPTGTLVLSGGGVSEGGSLVGPMGIVIKAMLVSRFIRQRVVRLDASPDGASLAALRALVDAGSVRPVIDRTFPFSETAEAIRYVETEHARAKVVITV